MSQDTTSNSYNEAVAALLSPLHQATTRGELRAAAARRTNTLQDMDTYLQRIGLDVNNSDRVPKRIFHLTGTKGKGSTLAFCESILRKGYGLNTGMFTSPHLVCIRERIRINGLPVSEEVFSEVYWTVRKKLEDFDSQSDDSSELPPLPKLPGYFRMLTLMAIYTFCHSQSPKIDAMLLEVGMGGRYDSTNVFEDIPGRSLIRGVTLIDYDHMRILGSTLEQIAWEKGGIFCSNKLSSIGRHDGGYESFLNQYKHSEAARTCKEVDATPHKTTMFASASNTNEVLDILHYVTDNDSQQCQLEVVDDSCIQTCSEFGMKGQHQRSNAALALTMCQHCMKQSLTTESLQYAFAEAFWPGRCHSLRLPNIINKSSGNEVSVKLRCDGAHTPISINACIDWFRENENDQTIHRVLIFNCSHERNPIPLLYSLHQSKLFDSVYFCRADFERPSMITKKLEEQWYSQKLDSSTHHEGTTLDDMRNILKVESCDASTWQETLANVWNLFISYESHFDSTKKDTPAEKVVFDFDVKSALQKIQDDVASMDLSKGKTKTTCLEICVTGSLYIVGSALEAAGWREVSASSKLQQL